MLLAEHPDLASSPLGGAAGSQRPLHVATDWPGFFPNGPSVAWLIIDAGADLDDRGDDKSTERPRCTGRRAATTTR